MKTDPSCVVYMATNKINGKRYVGATKLRFTKRRDRHFWEAKNCKKGCPIFHSAIRKYGEDAFEWTILAEANSVDELIKLEISLIALLKPEYNVTIGGRGFVGAKHSLETRAAMSKAHKGKKKPPRSQQTRAKMSAIAKERQSKLKFTGPLTQRRLMQVISYDSASGIFRRVKTANQNKVGGIVGNLQKNGFVRIVVDGRKYLAHRLAWLYVHGVWPSYDLYHKDFDRSNNRICNLQLATNSQLGAHRGVRQDNVLGIKGVRLHECGKHVARISCNGKSYYLGVFDSVEAATAAYQAKALELFGEHARAA